ncbi:error-prone DNA polymerase [Mesorhizobium albiziae]|uniref:Error-prone DNA polymerase n=1 Tax=Neomesorhizobium albiziae TaxID=335020 RepID=A0A1I3Y1R5_9HYPH|nr:error-prone DNA polymerase [Mesorhizobium albiziae]SFK25755.1 error-prone DNA polymerase [Mesorhizobium albiziae]
MNATVSIPYAEFAVQSNFSFLRAASKPEELVVTAKMLGLSAIGLADRNSVAGVVRAWQQTKVEKLPYHPGSRLVFADGSPDVLAYPRDRKGWGHLCRMLTQANMRGEKGAPVLRRSDLFEWGDRLSLAVLPDVETAPESQLEFLHALKSRFGDAVWLAVSPAYSGNDRFRLEQAASMANIARLPLMAVNDVLYHVPARRPLQDVLTAIRLNKHVAEVGLELTRNAERFLKPQGEMARLFRRYPEAIAETLRFAATLKFSLSDLHYNYPDEPTESGLEPQEELERLTWEGAKFRYPDGVPDKVERIIRHELETVRELNYARYFLTVHDIIKFARSQDILCQGRGSAANSVICYCLRITDVGPDIIDTLFERFISKERDEPPDIDVDFEHEKRKPVMDYIYNKYSEKHTSLAAAVVSYRGRSALREVAKAMGLSDDVRSALSGSIWGWSSSELGKREADAGGLNDANLLAKHVIDLANDIMGFPRHLSQHVGGFVITKDRLDEIVPIMKTAMDDRKMVEWDKDDLDAVKILKVDILALGMLSCLRRAFALLHQHYDAPDDHGRPVELATIKQEDQNVYDMICRADTLGVFQIESRAQMSMLPRLKPKTFYDLVIEVAIVRPGPIQGNMVHPYLRRRQGKEKPDYPKPELQEILGRTLGVPLFQEQAMKIAIVAGGFKPGEADQLRRAMATFKRTGTIGNYRQKMIDGMVGRGYEKEFAERCFKQIEGFGEYGFPESHAAAFGLLVYASCWFKTYYPDVFCAAILNSQPMGFYQPAQLVRDAQDHGVEILPVDINGSDWDCLLEERSFDGSRIIARHAGMRDVIRTTRAVRLGFRQVKGLPKERMEQFVLRRGEGYESVRDIWLRSGLDVDEIERLAQADAFRSIGLSRRDALWAVRALGGKTAAERLPLFDRPDLWMRDHEPETRLPVMPLGQHVIHDYQSLGLSLKAHPVSFLRHRLDQSGVTPNARLTMVSDGRRVSVAGLVLVRQRPGTGNAIFLTLEDEQAVANVIIWQRVFDRYRSVVMGSRFVRVHGRLQSESDVIHIVAERIEDLSSWLGELTEEAQAPGGAKPEAGLHNVRQNILKRSESRSKLLSREPEFQNSAPSYDELSEKTERAMPKGRNFH